MERVVYESYWQLAGNPFGDDCSPQFYFDSQTHQAALLKLRYLIENRKGLGLLVGATGSGKSFLTRVLAEELAESQGPFVTLGFPQLSAAEMLAYLAVELGAGESAVDSRTVGLDRTLREIERLLNGFAKQGKHPVIVVDEAHLIDDVEVFQSLRLLLNFQQSDRRHFTLLLSGQPELLPHVRRVGPLEERMTIKCVLRSLSLNETADYVRFRLQAAGGAPGIFDDAALLAVFELSGGVPRRINRLCDLALLVGFADESPSISAAQVEAVSDELTSVAVD
jgi:general secretion pathway protein A